MKSDVSVAWNSSVVANLVRQRRDLVGCRIVLSGVSELAVGEFDLRGIFNLVQKDHAAVLHQASMHCRNPSLDSGRASWENAKRARIGSSWGGRWARSRGNRSGNARSALAASSAVSCSFSTELDGVRKLRQHWEDGTYTVSGAATSLGPVAADVNRLAIILKAAIAVGSLGATRDRDIGRWAEDGLLRRRRGWSVCTWTRTLGRSGGWRVCTSAVASVQTACTTMTVSLPAVAIRRATASELAVGIASGSVEFGKAATTVGPGGGVRVGGRRSRCGAAGLATGAAVHVGGSAIAVFGAAGALVAGGIGVTDSAPSLFTTRTICRIGCTGLKLLGDGDVASAEGLRIEVAKGSFAHETSEGTGKSDMKAARQTAIGCESTYSFLSQGMASERQVATPSPHLMACGFTGMLA